MEEVQEAPTRVFINNLDSFASKWVARYLSARMPAPSSEGEAESEEEDRLKSNRNRSPAFQIVGTVRDKTELDRGHVTEEYLALPPSLTRGQLFLKLMECDVIVYNISQHPDQVEEALWAVSALHGRLSDFTAPKMFILVSTVMTWACTKPFSLDDLELPFTDEDFRRRRAHPSFKQHLDLEKRVAKMGKSNRTLFSTYVVASGLQYGMGEQLFHLFFKMSWLGREEDIPVYGGGDNIVPTIHVNDLARVVRNVIDHRPKSYYLLAVDDSYNTMEDIVKAVASVLGPGKIQKRPFEDAFLQPDLSLPEIDSMLINLRMEALHLKELSSIHWQCETGLVENIDQVVWEYRQTRGLLPICVCVLGPPAVGKTTVSAQICDHYKLHHIRPRETVSEVITHLENVVRNAGVEAENEDDGGLLDDQLLVGVMMNKLNSNPCKNQGFVLDGFPETCKQARELFPEFVLSLNAPDAFLKDRVMNLSEKQVQVHNYEQEYFLRRLALYREKNIGDETVLNYFDELDITPVYLDTTGTNQPGSLLLMHEVTERLGPPRNYGPDRREVEEEEKRRADERMRRETQEKVEEEQREGEETRQRAARWKEWSKLLQEVQQQAEEQLEVLSVPMKNYLMENVLPTLTQGLTECCSAQPQDPVDFLAEYLIKNNPSHL
ncbi:adenylate kinase 7 [Aulostomus maculatus]